MKRATRESAAAAARFYARVLRLYPKAHREEFGTQMRTTFEDSYRIAAGAAGRASTGFWLAVIWDELRSIAREHAADTESRRRLDGVLIGLLAVWGSAILLLPPMLPAAAWPQLSLLAAVFAASFLTAPSLTSLAAKTATVGIWLALILVVIAMAQAVHDIPDLVAPAVLLACMLFSAKTLGAWHAAARGIRLPAWGREELAYGLAAGLVGVAFLVLGTSTSYDFDALVKLVFFGLIPVFWAVAGFRTSWRHRSMVPGIYAALSTMLTGAAIWIVARPPIFEVSLQMSRLAGYDPSPSMLAGWQRTMSSVLFFGAVFGLVGAALGYVARESDAASAAGGASPVS